MLSCGGLFPNHDYDGQEDEEVAAEDEEDMGVIETYSNYKPSKLKVTFFIWQILESQFLFQYSQAQVYESHLIEFEI